LDWIKRIKENENEALKLLYKTYREEIISWLTKNYGIDNNTGAEIFQNAVVIFYDKVIQNKVTAESGNVKTYIYGICKNITLASLRKNKKETYEKQNYLNVILDSKDNQESENQEENHKILLENLEKIGNPCKRILELFYYNLYKFEEISEELGYKNGNTVKNLKFKCLKRLRLMILDIYKQTK